MRPARPRRDLRQGKLNIEPNDARGWQLPNCWLRCKPVAYAPNRQYVNRIGRIPLKLLSKPKNDVVHRAILNRPIIPKNLGEYLGSMNDTIHILHEQFEHFELVSRKVDRTARNARLHSSKVDASFTKMDLIESGSLLRATDCRPHSCQQFSGTEGFRNVVVGSQFQ